MKKFIVLFRILARVHIWQWSTLSSALFFYCSNFILISFLLDSFKSTYFLKIFSLIILNFTSAFIVKNAFVDDHASMRLYYYNHDSMTLITFLIAKISIFTAYIFMIQLFLYPWFMLTESSLYTNSWLYTLIWFFISSLYLSMHYLMAECFNLANRANSFMGFVTVLPLLIPWFIFSTAFVLYNHVAILGILSGLILFLTPCIIMAQKWLIKHSVSRL